MIRALVCAILVACLPLAAFADMSTTTKKSSPRQKSMSVVRTASGLKYVDLVVGKGAMPKVGQTISVLYTGRLTNGKVFDATSNRNNEPFETPIGVGQVIKGWDEGMLSMRVGESDDLRFRRASDMGLKRRVRSRRIQPLFSTFSYSRSNNPKRR